MEILSRLAEVESSTADATEREWAAKTTAAIRSRSPTSVAVTLAALRRGHSWNIAQAFRNEHAIAARFMRHSDFVTGVVARLIERTKARPAWNPAQLEDLEDSDVEAFFAECVEMGKPAPRDMLRLMNTGPETEYMRYPHAWLGLPSEQEVIERIKPGKSPEDIVREFVKEKDGKLGVKQKVEEAIELYNMRGEL
jgi:3-hydroxyisobutyryl-CoA hydrolase